MPTAVPSALTIRTYQVGFGDCFLVTFHYPKQDRHVLIDCGTVSLPPTAGAASAYLTRVATQIAKDCGGKLAAVVATHRHRDHVSGFSVKNGKGPGRIIRDLKPEVVVQPWTEDPRAKVDATTPTEVTQLRGFQGSLDDISSVAAHAVATAGRLTRVVGSDSAAELAIVGMDNIKNPDAVKNLQTMSKRRTYVYFGSSSGLEEVLPGVATRIIGPPTLKQSKAILKEQSSNPAEYWQLRADFWSRQARAAKMSEARSGGGAGDGPLPWQTVRGSAMPLGTRWHRLRLLQEQAASHLNIVRTLDDQMNNTSVILLFTIKQSSFLFPGDAQYENWSYALSQSDVLEMLRKVTVYKVGHHGSRNATPKSMWKQLPVAAGKSAKRRLMTFLSTREGVYGQAKSKTEVPRATLLTALRDGSQLTNTEDFGKGVLSQAVQIKVT